MNKVVISLCIPTSGVIEWVIPVLESIYRQGISNDLFEVIVTNNGENEEFSNKMAEYEKTYYNFIYRPNNTSGFMNQVEAFKLAKGKFIKFINHRMKITNGGLQYMIDAVTNNMNDKPLIFFLNGNLELNKHVVCTSFDEFVLDLQYFSSWSGGIGMWREDFIKLPDDVTYNKLFPHTTWLFYNYNKNKYIIDNKNLMISLDNSHANKGKYNLFNAFAVEYVELINKLEIENRISSNTRKKVMDSIEKFIVKLYVDFILRKIECSYDLSNYKDNINKYYSFRIVQMKSIIYILQKIVNKFFYWR